ncbi:hypothetical protein Pla110_34440 [Polystyrenella longa]|uniref:Uncharacterized protein n=1 Tax=Polystyrenella longa TaxID=2528007 RepID=A0A518CR42_9PLAN|nr:hypothetical protein Pla110_34440 [Polystyrenella longa]
MGAEKVSDKKRAAKYQPSSTGQAENQDKLFGFRAFIVRLTKNYCQFYKNTSGICGWATEVLVEQSMLRSLRSSVLLGF